MRFKDYYEVMGVPRGATQDEVKRACKLAQVPPGRQQGKERRGALQGVAGGLRGPQGPGKTGRVRPARCELAAGAGFPTAARLGQGLRVLRTPRRAGSGPHHRARSSRFQRFSSRNCSGPAVPSAAPVPVGSRPPAGAGLFRGRSGSRRRVELDLEDAYRGGARTIDLRTPELTPEGHVTAKPRTLRVSIPAGVVEGQQIRLAGQGSPGLGGRPSGDLYLEVNFRPHPLFKLDGRDVTVQLPVAPWEAALGETVSVPTLGGVVDMKLPPGARAGQRLRLRGRGLPGSTPGDQYVVLGSCRRRTARRAREFFSRMKQELPSDPRGDLATSGATSSSSTQS